MEGDDLDIIEVQFQVLNSINEVIKHESALYISYHMENYLIRLLSETHLCHKVQTTVQYFNNFSIIKVLGYLSSKGK